MPRLTLESLEGARGAGGRALSVAAGGSSYLPAYRDSTFGNPGPPSYILFNRRKQPPSFTGKYGGSCFQLLNAPQHRGGLTLPGGGGEMGQLLRARVQQRSTTQAVPAHARERESFFLPRATGRRSEFF